MRKIDLSGYSTGLPESPVVYNVRQSCHNVLFHPELRLGASDLLRHYEIATKITNSPDGAVLLEDAEYAVLERSLNGVHGFGPNDVEFVRRVQEAPRVEVAEKPDGEGE